MPGSRPTIRPSALARYVRPISAGDPASFLEILAGEERGFWGRGDRWTTWGGKLAELYLPTVGAETFTGEGGSDPRFSAIRGAAGSALGAGASGVGASPIDSGVGSLRWFGGFSFLRAQPYDPLWDGFPEARFLLPRVLLEASGTEMTLTVQGFDGEEGLAEEGEALAEALLAATRFRQAIAVRSDSAHSDQGVQPAAAWPGAALGVDDGGDGGDTKGGWFDSVERVVREIDAGRLEKAVLARVLDISLPRRVELPALLEVLREENPEAHLFLFEMAPDRIFFGAAPELLAEVRDGRFSATVVAGSMPRASSGEGDSRLSEQLLESAKDRREHLLTAEEMTAALTSRLEEMQVEEEPRVLTLSRIHHLESTIEGEIREGEDILSLVEALHPTPAVCGRPRDAAYECIREAEPFDRGWYAGPVGWFDLAGEGSFVPALRTAVGGGENWRLFAGAGIVKGSLPGAEWEETTLKFQAALQALKTASRANSEAG